MGTAHAFLSSNSNGQPREVTVRDRALRVVERSHPKANPEDSRSSGRSKPPGLVSGIAVQVKPSRRAGLLNF